LTPIAISGRTSPLGAAQAHMLNAPKLIPEYWITGIFLLIKYAPS
jgi:hypothetical protein